MIEEKKLVRLSLQFFAEGDDDGGDDFEDFFDDDVPEYYGSDNEEESDNAEDEVEAADDEDEAIDEGSDEGFEDEDDLPDADGGKGFLDDPADDQEDAAGEDAAKEDGAGDEPNNDLIAELRALGYVGNDLASLTADMKAKRERAAEEAAKNERAADKADGKNHIKSSKPGRSASGDGTAGVNEKRVVDFAERAGVSKEEARRVLSKHARMMN